MATVQQQLLTIEEFELLPDPADGSKLELVRGEVVVLPSPKARHGICCSKIGRLLGNHADAGNLGWVTTNDTGVILERKPDTLRGPDVAFWSAIRQPAMPEGYFEIPPDLVVEVLSPDDRRKDVQAKVKDYLTHGVPLIWVVDPKARTVMVHRGTLKPVLLGDADRIDGGPALPGFSCQVAELFA